MTSDALQYKDIAKSNFVFGGVKIFKTLIQLLKAKFVALLLGPSGMGIQSLLVSSITTLHLFSSFGIFQSSVKYISGAKDVPEKSKYIKTLLILSIILGLFGTLICLLFAQQICYSVFGNTEFVWMFYIISFALFFESVSNAQIAIFQGVRDVKGLGITSLIVAIMTLVVSLPLYYLGRENAIPYVVVLGYAISAFIFTIKGKKYNNRIKLNQFLFKETSKKILTLGGALMLSNCFMSILMLLLNVFINRVGNSADVGLYQAASACTYSAISILIAILTSDYYPRISSVIGDKNKSSQLLSQQVDLLLLILTPIIFLMIIFPNLFIRLLYSSEFLVVSRAVQIMAISLFFRIIWHSFSFIILAKGDKKTYLFVDALLGNSLFFLGNIVGFYLFGINGISISYVVFSFIIMIILGIVVNKKYEIAISPTTRKVASILLTACLLIFIFQFIKFFVFKLVLEFVLSMSIISYILIQINKRIGLFDIIKNRFLQRWKA